MSKTAHLATSIASGQVCLVNFAPNVEPDGRGTWDYSYEGTDSGIASLASGMLAAGAKVRANYDSGVATLLASFPFNPGADPSDTTTPPTAEVPIDRYSVKFGGVQVSLFALPKATNEAHTYDDNSGAYKKVITDAVNEGTPLTDAALPIGTYPFSRVIERFLSHGVDYINVDRPTLRRTRTYSYQYAERRVVTFNQYAYTTARLITEFSIPADILAILPANPSGTGETPVSSLWGWRITDQDLEYNPTSRKWEETVTWEFAAYDTGIFTILS